MSTDTKKPIENNTTVKVEKVEKSVLEKRIEKLEQIVNELNIRVMGVPIGKSQSLSDQ